MTWNGNHEGGLQLATAIRDGRISAVEALRASLKRAQDFSHLGAIRYFAADLALAEAERIDREHAEGRPGGGAFAGVPFLMKDLGTRVKGLPTVSGSKAMLRRSQAAVADDDLASRFRAAGFVIFGMTTVPEFGMTFTSEPPIGLVARNPLDNQLTPGGSSGGAAAAVSAGIVALAHANDAAGSIRVPAACCGLVGLKPSRGATPPGPDFGNYNSGIVGSFVVTRTLDDAAATLDGVTGKSRGPHPDPAIGPALAALSRPVPALRVGVVQELPLGLPFDESRRDAVVHAAAALRHAGHTLVPVEPSALADIIDLSGLAAGRVLCANLARMLGELDPPLGCDEIEPLTRAALTFGQSLKGSELVEAEMAIGRAGSASRLVRGQRCTSHTDAQQPAAGCRRLSHRSWRPRPSWTPQFRARTLRGFFERDGHTRSDGPPWPRWRWSSAPRPVDRTHRMRCPFVEARARPSGS